MSDPDIRRASLDEINAMKERGELNQPMPPYDRPLTLEELANQPDSTIDYSDIPELGDDFWKNAKLVYPDRRDP